VHCLIFAVLLTGQAGASTSSPPPRSKPMTAPRTGGQPVNRYDRAPAYLASPYPVYHREYYLPTHYNPSYAIPPSNLPLFPARTPDWSPSRTLWYSGRSVPWYFGYWYYPRYIPVQNALPVEPLLQQGVVGPGIPEYPATTFPAPMSPTTEFAAPMPSRPAYPAPMPSGPAYPAPMPSATAYPSMTVGGMEELMPLSPPQF
jgi:hypothetical protein